VTRGAIADKQVDVQNPKGRNRMYLTSLDFSHGGFRV